MAEDTENKEAKKLPETSGTEATQHDEIKAPPVTISPIVRWGYRYHSVVLLIVCLMALFGVFALDKMNKNEFPEITIREGVLVAVYPGADAKEMEDQVMKPMEDYIFSFKEVNKTKTRSNATNGMVMTFIELDDNVYDSDQFWAKFNMGLDGLKQTLPPGVLGMKLISNFGETSAILLTMQSKTKTYRELKDYMDRLTERLRVIPSVGTMTVSGMQNEQIAVIINPERLSRYAIDDKVISATLAAQGFKTTGGSLRSDTYTSPIYVQKPVTSVKELEDLFIMSLPSGQSVRLRDVADIRTEYPEPDSYITNNGEKCLLLSIEMKKGNNVVEMGRLVDEKLEPFKETLPEDVTLFKITNQPEVVNDSVWDFMKELLIAIVAVVISVMVLLPLRVALVAASTIPLTIFVSIGLFYAFDFELNTVTLACLIVSLGLIVDDSVVIIDNYVEQLAEGTPPKRAALNSASIFLKAIFSATLAITCTFFPFLLTTTGTMHDFLLDFPWAITIILVSSFVIATLHVPFMQYVFIKPEKAAAVYNTSGKKKHVSLLNRLQNFYNKVADWCFRRPGWLTVICAAFMIIGILMLLDRPMQMMPIAERNQFAVEINLPTGTALERTSEVADSLEAILAKDPRVVSIANFHGCSSPRFQSTYAPQVGGPNFAQFIVNTASNEDTEALLHEYGPKYEEYFPDAVIRFKQLSYSNAKYPIEVEVSGENLSDIRRAADTIQALMQRDPRVTILRSSIDLPMMATLVKPDPATMSRLGMSTSGLELSLAMRYGKGVPVATIWDGSYAKDIVVRTPEADKATAPELENGLIPIMAVENAPLSQMATVVPDPGVGQITHLNGVKTIYLMAGVPYQDNTIDVTKNLAKKIEALDLPEGVHIAYGGEIENTDTLVPQIIAALALAVVIIFVILLFHYKNVRVVLVFLGCIVFCIPGVGFGLWIGDQAFSITCTLGIISLMGILVRNVIIMFDFAEDLQRSENLNLKESILESAKRRMRPIFLTSTAASTGVIPMMLGKSPLWMPMAIVIFWGTIISFFFIVTIIPVIYWKTQKPVKLEEPDDPGETTAPTQPVVPTQAVSAASSLQPATTK